MSASSNPTPHSAAMSKTDDSSCSHTPLGAAENSVAFQYVAVHQMMASSRDHIEYQLTVREQPKQSRMCGVGEKADRRPIDPAPIVQLRVITHDRPLRQDDTVDRAPVAPPIERRAGHGPRSPKTAGVRGGLPVTTTLGDGWEDKAWYLENPYYFMYAMLCNADTDEELHLLNDGKTRYTSGSCVSCLYHLKDIDGSHQGFFVFPDLSIRVEGRYRLKLCLFETIGQSVHHCKSIYSDPFHVYTAKRFPGMEESTRLSKSFAEQGLKVRVRKHPRSRRRGSKRGKDESDGSDNTPLARDRSPKRARASDVLPVSGLPVPQPIASSRLPRSMDARFERGDYDREPLTRAPPHDARRAAWEEEQAMRARDPRTWDPRYDQAVYARHPREVDDRLPPPPPRDFTDGRYIDDYPPRTRIPPPHPAVVPSDYPEHARSAYPRDDPARTMHRPPPPSTQAPPSYPPYARRGHDPPAGMTASQGRSYPPAPAPKPLPPARMHSRGYGPPEQDPARAYDDYPPPPRRYNGAPYDSRSRAPRLTPSPPPGVEYTSRHYPPPSSAQWRSRPTTPNRLPEYPPQRSPPARGVAPPPTAFVDGRAGYPVYEPQPIRPASTSRPLEAYAREDARPSDIPPPAERFGQGIIGRDRPILPPLSVSPSLAQRERETAGYGGSERWGYPARGGEMDAEWERMRDRREQEFRQREWEVRGPTGPLSGGPPRGY